MGGFRFRVRVGFRARVGFRVRVRVRGRVRVRVRAHRCSGSGSNRSCRKP